MGLTVLGFVAGVVTGAALARRLEIVKVAREFRLDPHEIVRRSRA